MIKRMKPDSWMAFYWPKFQTSTSHMRREYKWSYFTAICRYYWDDCKGLPTDDQELMLICECYDLTNWAITKGYIFGEKFKLEDGKWHQNEARKIYNEAKSMMENNLKRVSAAIAANPNHQKHRNDNRDNYNIESSQSTSPESLRNPPIPIPIQKQSSEKTSAFAGEHKAFIEGWSEGFKKQFGIDYKVAGGRDGKAVKELLSMGILRTELLEIAKKAWKNQKSFSCKQAITIHGFQNNFNQIRVEVDRKRDSRCFMPDTQPSGSSIEPPAFQSHKGGEL